LVSLHKDIYGHYEHIKCVVFAFSQCWNLVTDYDYLWIQQSWWFINLHAKIVWKKIQHFPSLVSNEMKFTFKSSSYRTTCYKAKLMIAIYILRHLKCVLRNRSS